MFELVHTCKKAWSEYFKSYIVCVRYISDDHWYFTYIDDVDYRHVMRAKTKYSYFKWESV